MLRVADFPRPPAIAPETRRITIVLAGQVVAEAACGWRILETSHAPTYYISADAFRPNTLSASARTSFCEWKGLAHYVSISCGGRTERDAGWLYPDPATAYAPLKNHVAVYAGRMDACFIGDEKVVPQPGGFYGGWITADLIGPFKGGPGTEFW